LFAELPGKVVVGTANVDSLKEIASEFNIQSAVIGKVVQKAHLSIELGHKSIDWTSEELNLAFEGTFERLLNS
jgi:phosphoribosylformylglycinamidine (FGAM) synthase-like enzyme